MRGGRLRFGTGVIPGAGADVAQCADRVDRDTEGKRAADPGHHLHPLHERVLGNRQDRGSEPAWQLTGDGNRATERVTSDRGRFSGNARREVRADVTPVDRHPDAAEDRDPECATELEGGLGHTRCRPSPLRRG